MTNDDVLAWFESLSRQSWAWVNLLGQDKWLTTWVPTRTSWTDVGTPTVTTRYRLVGRKCEFQFKIVPSTSIATTAGTSYFNLPIAAAGIAGSSVMTNQTTKVATGVCHIDITNSRCYPPALVATGNTMNIYGEYEV